MRARDDADHSHGSPLGVRDLLRYCSDLGWRDPPELPESVVATAPGQDLPADLGEMAQSVQGCTRCPLAAKRKNVVFGEGRPGASIMFIGEAPGGDEDSSGRPFVGQAGQILDRMITAIGLDRDQVYITNVVKCRPPRNRDPEETEMAACAELLDSQVELVGASVIVALGRVAARRLTGSQKSMTAMRGSWSSYRGIPLMPIFHPAYLLRQPKEKRATWEDLKAIQAKLAEL